MKGNKDPYKVEQINKLLNADYFWALLKGEEKVCKNINLDGEALELLKAYYEGKEIEIKWFFYENRRKN